MTQEILTIHNEDEAWKFLQLALEDGLPEGILKINFDAWPVIGVKLEGESFQSSISTKNMEGFIELQKSIYRSFALAVYGKSTSKLLTKDEKASLSFVVRVSPGSSDLQADLKDALIAFATKMAEKMEAKHIMILVIGAGLLWGGNACWQSYLEELRQQRSEQYKIDATALAGEQELKRMEIMKEAMLAKPQLLIIKEDAEGAYHEVMKGFTDADAVTIADKRLERDTIKKIVKSSRTKSNEVRLDGIYKIKKVDSSSFDCFKVFVVNTETGQSFMAEVKDSLVVAGRNKSRLQQSEWERQPARLKINAKEVRGEITGAVIIGVEDIQIAQK